MRRLRRQGVQAPGDVNVPNEVFKCIQAFQLHEQQLSAPLCASLVY